MQKHTGAGLPRGSINLGNDGAGPAHFLANGIALTTRLRTSGSLFPLFYSFSLSLLNSAYFPLVTMRSVLAQPSIFSAFCQSTHGGWRGTVGAICV